MNNFETPFDIKDCDESEIESENEEYLENKYRRNKSINEKNRPADTCEPRP